MEGVITQGTLQTTAGKPLPLEHTDVAAVITGPVASIDVRQVFRNDTSDPIEAVYLFPLPHEASVHRMAFKIGERVVKAVVKEKEEARRAYQAALREGRSATLLEQDRPNLFTLSVANVPAGEAIEVTLSYQEKVSYDEGEWRFVFPMVTTERYHPGAPVGAVSRRGTSSTDEVLDAGRIRPPRPASSQRRPDVAVNVEIRAGAPITAPRSPSHDVEVVSVAEGAYTVRLRASDSIPNRDLVIVYGDPRPGVRAEVSFERTLDRVGTFLLTVTPPAVPLAEETLAPHQAASGQWRPVLCGNCGGALENAAAVHDVPGIGPAYRCSWCGAVVAASSEKQARRAAMSRDVVFLVDRSCSMRGASLAQARRAVRMVLDHLGPDDGVQLFAFDHDRKAVDERGEEYLPLDTVTINRIDQFLAILEPRGGTELEKAIEHAVKLPARNRRARVVVLVTDAAVGNEGRLLRRVPELLGADARLYVLGIGPAVNRYLVARLARAGGGASDVLLPTEDVETVVPRFARRVRQAGPVLRDLRLSWDDALPVDVYPSPIPPLFGGQTVQLLGRFNGVGPSRLVLTGTTALDEPFRQEVEVVLPEASNDIPGLERLWARLRIDALVERRETAPDQAAEVRLEVLGLALRHSLLSPYTSLVAEDSERRVKGEAKRVDFALDDRAELQAAPARQARPAGVAGFEVPAAEAPSDWEDDDPGFKTCAGTVRSVAMPPAFMAPGAPPVALARPMAPPAPMHSMPAPAGPPPMPCSPRMAPPPLKEVAGGAVARSREGGIAGAARQLIDHVTKKAPAPEPWSPAPPHQPTVNVDPYTPEMLRYLEGRHVGELDLVFLVDETGSMGPYIEQVKRRLMEIIEVLRAAPLCRSLRLGLVSYRDHPPQDMTFVSRVVPLTEDIDAIARGVNAMAASGGGDGPEAVTDGLFDVVRLDWRRRAARVVVWVGDAPPHGVEPSGDGFPAGCPCGHHWYAQAESAREMGVTIHAVGCLPGLRHYTGAEEVFRTVARTSRGLYLPLSEAHLLIPLITGVAESDLDRQRIEEHVADVLDRHRSLLEPADDQERVRFVTDVLRQDGVRPRSFLFDESSPSRSSLRFRDLRPDDVAASLDQLRRLGRTSL